MGGRPPGLDAAAEKGRNVVERFFAFAKQWRGIATRYDKLAITANFRRAGARLMVVATVVETVDELERTASALVARRMLHVRLTASPDAVLSRLLRRHNDDDAALRWHAQRRPELAGILN